MVDATEESKCVLAQHLVIKVTWWAAYPRLISVTASTLSTYDPETLQCTNQWEMSEIEDVEVGANPDQLVIRLEKTRFRSVRLRFQCAARSHLLALLAQLRRRYRCQPLRFHLRAALGQDATPQYYYRCVEQFANTSYKLLLMQVTVRGVLLVDDRGRMVETLPFVYLERAYATHDHPEGMVIATAYQERLFLCDERDLCLEEIDEAASAVGVKVCRSSRISVAEMTIEAMRERNNKILNQPSLVRFEVGKVISFSTYAGTTASTAFKKIQIVLQGDALVEVHRSMRSVIAWPYAALLAIIRPENDPNRVTFEFAREESLTITIDARDQLIVLLLLALRESGLPLVPVCSGTFDRSRFFHPHSSDIHGFRDGSRPLPVVIMPVELLLLRRLIRTDTKFELVGTATDNNAIHRVSNSRGERAATTRQSSSGTPERPKSLEEDTVRGEGARRMVGEWFQRKIGDRKHLLSKRDAAARHSMDSADVSMTENVSIRVAMEELNANTRFGELMNIQCNQETILKAIEVVIEHLVALVTAMGKSADNSNTQISVALQTLTRLTSLPGAFLFTGMASIIDRVLDAVQELLFQRDSLVCYWCLKLLQAFFEAEKSTRAATTFAVNSFPSDITGTSKLSSTVQNDQRLKTAQNVVQRKEIQRAIIDLLPTSFDDSTVHSGYWMHEDESDALLMTDNSIWRDKNEGEVTYEVPLLQTSEAHVRANMNIVHFDALLTIHQMILHLARTERQQSASTDHRRHQETCQHHLSQANNVNGDSKETPVTRQSATLAEQLLKKIRFITDSVLDMRLTRSAETSVALVKFLIAHLSKRTTKIQRRNSILGAAAHANQNTSVHLGDRHERRLERRNSIATTSLDISNQDDIRAFHDSEGGGNEINEINDRKAALSHLKAFLEEYTRNKHPVENRSRLFRTQHTILAPLSTLSQQTASDNMTEVVMSYRRECERQLQAVCSSKQQKATDSGDDPLTLEQLLVEAKSNNSSRIRSYHRDRRHRRQSMCGSTLRSSSKSRKTGEVYSGFDSAYLSTSKGTCKKHRRHSVASIPSLINLSHLGSLSTSQQTPADDNQHEEQQPGERLITEKRKITLDPLTASRRAVAHGCDACIGCNDVCADNNCFFCAQKKYQLQVTFGDSTTARGDSQRTSKASSQDQSSSLPMEQRQYSSCEMRRHQTLRSCWILVDGDVYDVTDVLGAHPGGARVLLHAAVKGIDCATEFAYHPPATREVLANYRLGTFYHCDRCTLDH